MYPSIPPMENLPKKPLLTPGQNHLLSLPNIKSLIQRFDLHPYSSPEAHINAMVAYKTQVIISSISSSKQPPKPDFSQYAPLSEDGASKYRDFIRKAKQDKLPPGYCLDSTGKTIFDKQWKTKGLSEKQLPHDHPDYVPF